MIRTRAVAVAAAAMLTSVLLPVLGFAASFDCKKASTQTEMAICKSSDLSEYDDFLSVLYKARIKNSSKEAADDLLSRQREWIVARDTECGARPDCLLESYRQRAEVLIDAKLTKQEGKRATFPHLGVYKDERFDPYDLLVCDVAINGALRKLMGTDYKKYRDTATSFFVQGPLVGEDGVLFVKGGKQHDLGGGQFALVVNPDGNIYLAIYERTATTQRIYYYSNDDRYKRELQKNIQEWWKDFQTRVIYRSK